MTSHLYPLGEQQRERCHDGLGPLVEPTGRVARYVYDRLGRRHCSVPVVCGDGVWMVAGVLILRRWISIQSLA